MDDPNWEEYRILQGKIDKIGEFKFLVRGWTVTLASAAVVANIAADLPSYAFIGAILLVALFQTLEEQQAIWSRAFGQRAKLLEGEIQRNHRAAGGRGNTPSIVADIIRAGMQRRSRRLRVALFVANRGFYPTIYVMILGAGLAQFLLPSQEPPHRVTFKGPITVQTVHVASDTTKAGP